MNINIKSIIGILALLVGLCSATSRGECKTLCNNDVSQSLSPAQMCQSALQSSPASVNMNYHHCVQGRKLSLRKTCLAECMNEEITLTSFDVCSKHVRRRDELTWCRRGYENTFDSMKLLLGAQDQEDVTNIHDESVNVVTSIDEKSLIEEESLTIETVSIEREEVPMKNESDSLVLDDQSVQSFSSTFEEEKTTLQLASIVNKTDSSSQLTIDSSNVHIDRTMMSLDQFFTHTIPCLDDEMNLSFVDEDEASLDVFLENELDQPDSKELLLAISHDIVDALSIVCIILTSITVVFFASIIVWLSTVHCWTLLVGIISCLKSTTFLGRASLTTTTRSIADTLYKRVTVSIDTTTSLIRILLLPIESLLNLSRWIRRVYGPGSHGQSVWHIMFNSNPKQGRKRCKVASTFNAIVQGLLDTGQASLLKMTCLLFTSARLVQVLAIRSYVLVRSVAISISKDVGDCLHITRDASVGMIRLIRVSIVKSHAIIHSAVVLPFIKATRDCLYHVQASVFGMARRTYALAIISYAIVHSLAASIFKAVRGCIHSTQTFIFGMARRIQVSIIISYVLARSVVVSLSNDVKGCLYHILSPLFGILLVPRWYWKEFGPYSQGRSVFDILFKSNPRQRIKRGGQVASSRLNNIETYTYHQYLPWLWQIDPGIYSTIHCARSCIESSRLPEAVYITFTLQSLALA